MKPPENPVTTYKMTPEELAAFRAKYEDWGNKEKAKHAETRTKMGMHDGEVGKLTGERITKITWEQLKTELDNGMTVKEIAKAYRVTETTVRRRMKMGR